MGITFALLLVCVQAEPQPKLAVTISYGHHKSQVISDAEVNSSEESASESQPGTGSQLEQDLDTLLDRTGLHTSTSHSSASINGAYAESSLTSVALFDLDANQPGIHAGSQLSFDARLTDMRREVDATLLGLSVSKVIGTFVINEPHFVAQEVQLTWRIEFHAWSNTSTIPNAIYVLEANVGNAWILAGWDHDARRWITLVRRTVNGKPETTRSEIRQPGTTGFGAKLRPNREPRFRPIEPLDPIQIDIELAAGLEPEPEPEPLSVTFNRLNKWSIDVSEVMEMEALRTCFRMDASTEIWREAGPELRSVPLQAALSYEHPSESVDILLEARVYCRGVTPAAENPNLQLTDRMKRMLAKYDPTHRPAVPTIEVARVRTCSD